MKKEIKREPQGEDGIFYAYFAPDGALQVRSIGTTKKESREFIRAREYHPSGMSVTWRDYEKKGYVLRKIRMTVTLL